MEERQKRAKKKTEWIKMNKNTTKWSGKYITNKQQQQQTLKSQSLSQDTARKKDTTEEKIK